MGTAQHTETGGKILALHGLEIRPGCVVPFGELEFRFSRSGGPGGQNVNKVASKVDLLFEPGKSRAFAPLERERILQALAGRMEGEVLRVTAEESRSQWENRRRAMEKLVDLLAAALRPKKKRRPTRVGVSVRLRRKESKRRQSVRKRLRKPPDRDGDS